MVELSIVFPAPYVVIIAACLNFGSRDKVLCNSTMIQEAICSFEMLNLFGLATIWSFYYLLLIIRWRELSFPLYVFVGVQPVLVPVVPVRWSERSIIIVPETNFLFYFRQTEKNFEHTTRRSDFILARTYRYYLPLSYWYMLLKTSIGTKHEQILYYKSVFHLWYSEYVDMRL